MLVIVGWSKHHDDQKPSFLAGSSSSSALSVSRCRQKLIDITHEMGNNGSDLPPSPACIRASPDTPPTCRFCDIRDAERDRGDVFFRFVDFAPVVLSALFHLRMDGGICIKVHRGRPMGSPRFGAFHVDSPTPNWTSTIEQNNWAKNWLNKSQLIKKLTEHKSNDQTNNPTKINWSKSYWTMSQLIKFLAEQIAIEQLINWHLFSCQEGT